MIIRNIWREHEALPGWSLTALQWQGEMYEAGHGGQGQLVDDVSVCVQGQHTPVVWQGEHPGTGYSRAQAVLRLKYLYKNILIR